MFTIIVLSEAVLAAASAVQTAADERHGAGVDQLVLAGSGLLLAACGGSSSDRTAQRMLRTLRTTIIWSYGHYFIFAATAVIAPGSPSAPTT